MKILGISAYYHDSSAALLVDGTVVAAAQEERFTRVKHDYDFPANACRFCLDYVGLAISDIDAVVFYEKPFLKFERIIVSQITSFPHSLPMFLKSIPIWLKDKLNMRGNISRRIEELFGEKPRRIGFIEHHLSHAALAYCTSGFENSDILIVDAVGEWATTSIMRATGNQIEVVSEQRFPDSIGMLYSSATQFLGFKVNSDEYKVMGLAPYGDGDSGETSLFIEKIKSTLVSISSDDAIDLNLSYFKFHYGDEMIDKRKWEDLFGIECRTPDSEITQAHKNLAYAFQSVTEDILLRLVSSCKTNSNNDNLCIAGGVALNCAANGVLKAKELYDNIYVPFAPGDCGCSIGAAMAYDMLERGRNSYICPAYLGPEYTDGEIEAELDANDLDFRLAATEDELCQATASLISQGKIVGWFQGRMEFGPRALGNRSILADARNPRMKDMVNSRIKFRESFRPFAPSVLKEKAKDLFNQIDDSPYMMFTTEVNSDAIPAVTHIDGTARVQTVLKDDNPLFHKLISAFYEQTGCPVILNTSFNVMGEPIVCTPLDAIKTFKNSGLDHLVIGNYIVGK